MQTQIRYALKNPKTDKFIALDGGSGYPYDVDDITTAKHWHNVDDAERYNAVFSWENYNRPVYDLYEVTIAISVEPVQQRTGKALENLRYNS